MIIVVKCEVKLNTLLHTIFYINQNYMSQIPILQTSL